MELNWMTLYWGIAFVVTVGFVLMLLRSAGRVEIHKRKHKRRAREFIRTAMVCASLFGACFALAAGIEPEEIIAISTVALVTMAGLRIVTIEIGKGD